MGSKVKIKKGDIEVELESDDSSVEELVKIAIELIRFLINLLPNDEGGPPDL